MGPNSGDAVSISKGYIVRNTERSLNSFQNGRPNYVTGKTDSDNRKGKPARRLGNKHACSLRESGGKERGSHSCRIHKGK